MFRDTRRIRMRRRAAAAVLGAAVLAGGIWLNHSGKAAEETEDAARDGRVEETEKKDSGEANEKKKERVGNEKEKTETGTEQEPQSYLIKEVDGVVKVFLCDSEGNEELYLITSIPFDLLSEGDQELFEEGVYMETEDDLGNFLENFDS